MSKLIRKVISLGIISTLICNFPLITATAGSTNEQIYLCELKEDLSNCTIFYSTEYADIYGAKTIYAATSWHSNDLLFTLRWYRTNSSNCTAFCNANYEISNSSAYTVFFSDTKAGIIDPNVNDWNYCAIYVNTFYNATTATIAHEFGHVMGLAHNNSNPNSIMCQSAFGRVATVPSNYDRSLLSYKYFRRG